MIKGLPEKLQALRSRYHYSQKQVAERVGLSPAIISSYELGTRTPSTETILSLARLYHCSTDYLLGNDTTPVHVVLDTEGLSDDQLHVIQELIKTMKHE